MNDTDRRNIASLLDNIATGDCGSQVNAAMELLKDHPKIIPLMESTKWWGVGEKDPFALMKTQDSLLP